MCRVHQSGSSLRSEIQSGDNSKTRVKEISAAMCRMCLVHQSGCSLRNRKQSEDSQPAAGSVTRLRTGCRKWTRKCDITTCTRIRLVRPHSGAPRRPDTERTLANLVMLLDPRWLLVRWSPRLSSARRTPLPENHRQDSLDRNFFHNPYVLLLSKAVECRGSR